MIAPDADLGKGAGWNTFGTKGDWCDIIAHVSL